MPEEFSWSFELVDKVTASATRMERSLVNIEQALKRAQGSARAGTGSWAMFGIKMGAVAGIASAVTRELIDLGGQVLKMGATGAKWALEAGSFNENTQLSLEAILGSASAAQRALSTWGRLAENTPFDVRNVIEWGKQLTVAGESVENTVTVLKAVSDIGAKLGSTPEQSRAIAQQTIDMFARIKQLGSEASIRNLREFANLGISPGKIEQVMAAKLTGGNVELLRKGMMQARSAGVDMSREIIAAALKVGEQMTGPVGTVGKKAADTLSSHFTRLQQRVTFDIFKGFEKTAGYKAIDKVLSNLISVLDPRSASGKAIQAGIAQLSDAFAKFLGPLTGTEGKKNMVDFFQTMKASIEAVLGPAATLAGWVFGLGQRLGQGAAGIAAIGSENKAESTEGARQLYAALGMRGAVAALAPNNAAPMQARPSVNVTNTIHIHGNADAEVMGHALEEASERAVQAAFERFGMLAGAQ